MRSVNITYIWIRQQGRPCDTMGFYPYQKQKRGANESVYVRDKLVAELLRRQKAVSSRGGRDPNAALFKFSMPTIRKQIKIVLQGFGLNFAATALHGLRYGGATNDDMHGRLTRDEIQQRGRWASANSMRKYLQPNKVHAQVQDLPTSVRDKLKRRMARRYHISNVTPPPVASDGGDEPRIEPLRKKYYDCFVQPYRS